MRRLATGMVLGVLIGAGVVLLVDDETRKIIWNEVVRNSSFVRERFEEYKERIIEAVEIGKEEARLKESQLEGQVSLDVEEAQESPGYIV